MPAKISAEVLKQLGEIGLESIGPKLDALGVRGCSDLSLVDDADLVRWGLSTIERRKFFGMCRQVLGERDGEGELSLLPPSALTTQPVRKTKARTAVRPETQGAGPARLDELLGRGSAEHQVPRLAERLLSATGPLDLPELASRLSRAAPALATGYDAMEWPQFVEACIRAYKRLKVEEGVLATDSAVVSICNSVLFSASEEVVSDVSCWVKVCLFLSTPAQVAIMSSLCRSSREVADGQAVWTKLLSRWYPKATLLNPDWIAQSELEKRLEAALENDYALAALTRRNEVDTPLSFTTLMSALPQQTTPKALMKFMSKHPDNFRQSPDGKKFAVARSVDDFRNCKEWRTVNPFSAPQLASAPSGGGDDKAAADDDKGPAPVPMGMPTEMRKQAIKEQREALEAKKDAKPSEDAEAPVEASPTVCQQLDPKQAFRLYHTGLLSQRTDQSKRGKLEAWEYYTESNSKCVLAPSDLLDLADSRARSVRTNDPAVVHELVSQTLEGMVYKVPFGFWNRRVRILSNALNSSQLRIGREQKKKLERKLVEFMEWVKKERGFGYYQCSVCGARWKSGFSYEEIAQQCLTCGNYERPYRIQDLESKDEREARERGEDPPPRREPRSLELNNHKQAMLFNVPMLEHSAKGGGKRRADGSAPIFGGRDLGPTGAKRFKGSGTSEEAYSRATMSEKPPEPERKITANRWARNKPTTSAGASTSSAKPSDDKARYQPGGGGFFAKKKAAEEAEKAAKDVVAETTKSTDEEPNKDAKPSYKPGSGGFFARRKADEAPAEPTASEAASGSAAGSSPAASSTQAGGYKPGGGGFFARKAAEKDATASAGASASASASSSSAAPAKAASPAAAAVAVAGAAAGAGSAASGSGRAAAPAEEAGYRPGGGGFFARRRAAEAGGADGTASTGGSGSSSSSSAPAATPPKAFQATPPSKGKGKSKGKEEPAPPPSEAQAAAIAAAEAPLASVRAVKAEETYEPGGGGFFARRRGGTPAPSGGATSSGEPSAAVKNFFGKKTAEEKAAEKAAEDKKEAEEKAAKEKAAEEAKKKAEAERKAEEAKREAEKAEAAAKKAEADKAKAEAEKPVKMEVPPDKMAALQVLGLSVEEGVKMGIIPKECLEPPKTAAAAKPAAPQAEEGSDKKRKMDLEELRKAKAARFAAAKSGNKAEEAQGPAATAGESVAKAVEVCSDESLVDAISACVTFGTGASGEARVLSAQASDAAYLVSDAVFWALLRRLAVEIAALEKDAKDVNDFWASSPSGAEGAVHYATERGYLLPEGLTSPTADSNWRRALLSEIAADLICTRLRAGRGFDLPALAGPAGGDGKGWVEKPADDLEGVAQAVDTKGSVKLAEELVDTLAKRAAVETDASKPIAERMSAVADTMCGQGVPPVDGSDAGTAPVLSCSDLSIMQEMGVREQVEGIRREYTLRRQVLLRRLDLTIQVMTMSAKSKTATAQRKIAEVLSRMWAGWRRNASEAPPISEWSALATTRGVLGKAVTARVSGPQSRVSSWFKSVKIGTVPNRGGKPEGYSSTITGGDSRRGGRSATAAAAVPKASEQARSAPVERAADRRRAGKSFIREGEAGSSGSAPRELQSAVSQGPANIGPKRGEDRKQLSVEGARSGNLDLAHAAKKARKEELESGKKSDYYDQLAAARGGAR